MTAQEKGVSEKFEGCTHRNRMCWANAAGGSMTLHTHTGKAIDSPVRCATASSFQTGTNCPLHHFGFAVNLLLGHQIRSAVPTCCLLPVPLHSSPPHLIFSAAANRDTIRPILLRLRLRFPPHPPCSVTVNTALLPCSVFFPTLTQTEEAVLLPKP
ncbi:hypothetical protein Droror1_Dr00003352 [Drosera rotundifolia]